MKAQAETAPIAVLTREYFILPSTPAHCHTTNFERLRIWGWRSP
ncbi:hypothetical protein [Scytonema sp. NUACC26]